MRANTGGDAIVGVAHQSIDPSDDDKAQVRPSPISA
jgi:hypothetical protein